MGENQDPHAEADRMSRLLTIRQLQKYIEDSERALNEPDVQSDPAKIAHIQKNIAAWKKTQEAHQQELDKER